MAKKDRKTWLTDREKLFVLEYCKDLHITNAAIRAWYSEKTAAVIWYENLNKPHIQAALSKEIEKKFDKAGIDWDWVVQKLVSVAKKCLQEEKIKKKVLKANSIEQWEEWTKVSKERETVEDFWEFDPSGANKALENLGKYFKLFVDEVKHTHIFSLSELFDKSENWEKSNLS